MHGIIVKTDSKDGIGEGELLVKGDIVMKEYYGNTELTNESFTSDGFFKTGDIGYKDSDGYIYITGRKKNVIILDNGKNIYPEELEKKLLSYKEISEVIVCSEDNILVAKIFPNFSQIDKEDNIQKVFDKLINKFNRSLPYYKKIHRVELVDKEFEKNTMKKIRR